VYSASTGLGCPDVARIALIEALGDPAAYLFQIAAEAEDDGAATETRPGEPRAECAGGRGRID